MLGELRADGAGEAERAPDIAEPGRRGGRRVDKGISSSLLDESFSLVSESTMAPLSLGCVVGANDPREKDDGRFATGAMTREIMATGTNTKYKVSTSRHTGS